MNINEGILLKLEIKERVEQIQNGIVPDGYKKTKVGIIPEDWEVEKLDDEFKVYSGESIPRSKLGDFGFPYLHYGDIHKMSQTSIKISDEFDSFSKINKELENIKNGALLDHGDVVFADASEDYDGVGKHVVIENINKIPFVSGLHTIIAKPINALLTTSFLKYVFSNIHVRRQFKFYATGISVLGITLENIKRVVIPAPNSYEQKRIASILETWDRAIELKEKLIQEKQTQKKGLMDKLFLRKVKDSRMVRVGTLINESKIVEDTPTVDKLLSVKLHLGGVFKRTLRGNETVGATTLYKRKSGQFIYGKQNFHNGALGLIPKSLDGYLSSSDIPSFDFNEDKVSPKYFYYYWSREYKYKRLENFTTGTGSKRLNPKDIYKIRMELPSLSEQQHIAKILSTADQELELLKEEVELLKEQKKGLMQLLLTGIIRV